MAVANARKRKVSWSREEDETLVRRVRLAGADNNEWSSFASSLPGRNGKQCRERWYNILRPDRKRGKWSAEEDNLLATLQKRHGNKWATISEYIPGRSDNDVKNHWNNTRRSPASTFRDKRTSLKKSAQQAQVKRCSHEGCEKTVKQGGLYIAHWHENQPPKESSECQKSKPPQDFTRQELPKGAEEKCYCRDCQPLPEEPTEPNHLALLHDAAMMISKGLGISSTITKGKRKSGLSVA